MIFFFVSLEIFSCIWPALMNWRTWGYTGIYLEWINLSLLIKHCDLCFSFYQEPSLRIIRKSQACKLKYFIIVHQWTFYKLNCYKHFHSSSSIFFYLLFSPVEQAVDMLSHIQFFWFPFTSILHENVLKDSLNFPWVLYLIPLCIKFTLLFWDITAQTK